MIIKPKNDEHKDFYVVQPRMLMSTVTVIVVFGYNLVE